MIKCEFCKKAEFPTNNQLRGHKAKCHYYVNFITKYRNKILTKKYLKKQLVDLGRSCYQLELELNDPRIKTCDIIARAKQLGLPTQTIKEAANNPLTKQKRIQSNLEKYGYKNNFQSKKTLKTLKKKYGKNITNVFQLDFVKEKSRKTMVEKYGVENPVCLPNHRRNVGNVSWQHRSIEKILDKHEVIYDSENKQGVSFSKYNKKLKRNYNPRPDIVFHKEKIIFEIYGDYYHANPKKYEPNDLLVTWAGELKAFDIWEKDKNRTNHLKSFGYKVYVFWGSDIRSNSKKVERRICRLLKLKKSPE